ncbi:MAG: hypothetical protein KC910_36435 [Candidatus Eremiobacteraeota bacterium]|nr:hypothetical protein [Candidatus Eremiobacteraeota bacterium]
MKITAQTNTLSYPRAHQAPANQPNQPQDKFSRSEPGPSLMTRSGGWQRAKPLVGMGVMMTGMMVGAQMGSPWGPAVMMGSMFAGMAIMVS